MGTDVESLVEDFELQSKMMEVFAKANDADDVWRAGRWIAAAADLHRILLRRNQIIGDCLGNLRDLWGKTGSPTSLAPLNLPDERQSFLSAIKLLNENGRANAYEYLQRLRATNVWWRT